jgi:hypothetical protein
MFWRTLKRLNFSQLLQLLGITLGAPIRMIKTAWATKVCIQICNREFGQTHHLHNRANAIRHALWNILIIKSLYGKRSNMVAIMAWAEKITSWHEDFSVNEPLERAMDLHNNEVGRKWFSDYKFASEKEIVNSLKQRATKARQIQDVTDVRGAYGRLVFISE